MHLFLCASEGLTTWTVGFLLFFKQILMGWVGGEPRVCLQRAKISKEFFNICLEFSFLDFHELD